MCMYTPQLQRLLKCTYSPYVRVQTTGAGLQGDILGAAEGVSYLVILGLIGWSVYTKTTTGKLSPRLCAPVVKSNTEPGVSLFICIMLERVKLGCHRALLVAPPFCFPSF